MKKTTHAKKRLSLRRKKQLLKFKNHPFIVPVITILVMLFLSTVLMVSMNGITISASDSHIVKLSINGQQSVVRTRATTVTDLLKRANITINTGDVVEPDVATTITEDDFRVNLYRAKPVTVLDGDKRIQALSAATTPRSVVRQIGLNVYPEDYVTVVGNDASLRESVLGQKIVIDRASPANINLYGTNVLVRTHAKTVGELLKEKNIKVSAGDTVQPDQTTVFTPSMQVFVIGNGIKVIGLEEDVPMPIEIIDDPSLSFGTSAVRQIGSAGRKLVSFQIDVQNGKEVSRKIIQEVMIIEPVKQTIARGKAVYVPADKAVWMAAAGIAVSDYPYVQYIINHENALWCPTRWQGQRNCPPYYQELYAGAETNTSLGYGMCQSTPAAKMATAGADWRTNAVTQLRWCTTYASRYGGWQGAYETWVRRSAAGHGWW